MGSETRVKPRRITYTRPHLYPKQLQAIFEPKDVLGADARFSWIEASTKAGKAQPLDAIVWTPVGPKRMGDIVLGEYVLTPSGTALVSGIYPQGERPIYKIGFSDGTAVEADADHLWEVHEFKHGAGVFTTKELLTWPAWRLRSAWVPLLDVEAQFKSKHVPLDPYLLGVLIGDGSIKYGFGLSSADPFIVEQVRQRLPKGHYLRKEPGANYDWCITAGGGAARLREDGHHIGGKLAMLGLKGKGSSDKFIPAQYRYNSVAVRQAVLQGILDTDGWVDRNGQPCLDQTSERLAKDVEEIVQSLGGSVLTTTKQGRYKDARGKIVQCRQIYSQRIRLADVSWCFTLPRKVAKTKPRCKTPARKFRTLDFVGYKQAQCIEVFDQRHLYLTNGFIPTHNTVGCIAWIYEQAYLYGAPNRNWWWVAPVYNQAEIAFRRLKAYLPKDQFTANEGKLFITLPNGGRIWFKGADKPDSLYGEDVYGCVIDEGSRCKEDAYHAVRSTLTATRGPLRVIGNVKGRKNWFYKNARKAEAGLPNHAYYRITANDAVAAGVLDKEEIEGAESDLPANVFRELYKAEASNDEGNPFGIAYLDKIRKGLSRLPVMNWGIDLAKKRDWTVIIGLDKNGDIAFFERFRKDWEATTDHIINLIGMSPALIDATGVGDPIVERVQKRCPKAEGYIFTQRSKQRLMEGLAVAIQRGETSVLDESVENNIHYLELESFEYTYTRTGVSYSAPEGMTDDTVMAHGLAVQRKSQGSDLSVWEKLAA